jgi:hypothetical protein
MLGIVYVHLPHCSSFAAISQSAIKLTHAPRHSEELNDGQPLRGSVRCVHRRVGPAVTPLIKEDRAQRFEAEMPIVASAIGWTSNRQQFLKEPTFV